MHPVPASLCRRRAHVTHPTTLRPLRPSAIPHAHPCSLLHSVTRPPHDNPPKALKTIKKLGALNVTPQLLEASKALAVARSARAHANGQVASAAAALLADWDELCSRWVPGMQPCTLAALKQAQS